MRKVSSSSSSRILSAVVVALTGGSVLLGSTEPAFAAPPTRPLAHRDIALLRGSPHRDKIALGLILAFERRPSISHEPGRSHLLEAQDRASVAVRFPQTPSDADVAAVERAGMHVNRKPDGSPWRFGRYLLAKATPRAIASAALIGRVERMELDGSPFGVLSTLDATAAEIGATDAWRTTSGGIPVDGSGVTVCDVDSGIDPFHPSFFRADGGYFAWIDVNQNGSFEPGTDLIDVGKGVKVPLALKEGIISYFWDPEPLLGSEEPQYDPAIDWLYADLNSNGSRDQGPSGGFSDASPSFGEPLLVADDVNGDGKLQPQEKLVALKSSKIAQVFAGGEKYVRGQNLIAAPRAAGILHGTGVGSVIVGGQRGLTRFVGIASGADLVMVTRDAQSDLAAQTTLCVESGARVIVHEYGGWVGEFMDGSGPVEALIDSTSDKAVHTTAAGNLGGSNKGYSMHLGAGNVTDIPISVDQQSGYAPFGMMLASLLWREPTRKLIVTLEDPNGVIKPMASTAGEMTEAAWGGGLTYYTERADSIRGTARLDVYVYDPDGKAELPSGDWILHVDDTANKSLGPYDLVGFLVDDRSEWGAGIQFTAGSSEEHFITCPATADSSTAVAAYALNGYIPPDAPGTRNTYSGRGTRIDGMALLSVAAPSDPITAGYFDGNEARYVMFNGTSGATPHVSGTAALLMQVDPTLDGFKIRDRLRQSALSDDNVGAVPNTDWGYGKLRTFKALYGKDPPGGSAPQVSAATVTAYRGKTATVALTVSDPDESSASLKLELDRDYDGNYEEPLTTPSFSAKFDKLGKYFSKVRVTDSTGRSTATLAEIDVVNIPPPAPLPKDDGPAASNDTALTGRSCGCVVPGGPAPSPRKALLLLLTALALLTRRRPAPSRPSA